MPATKALPIVALSEMVNGQEADLFVVMTIKEELKTRDGKPYYKVGFRDFGREVSFPIWSDSAFAIECRDSWCVGKFYKLRATYRDTNFGPQLEIRKIREVIDGDAADGFDPLMCQAQSRYDATEMFEDLLTIARTKIEDPELRQLVIDIMEQNRELLLMLPAATRNHHAYVGGYLEHVRSVTQTAVYLAEKYDAYYPDLEPRLNRGVCIAGAILHDIGKLREIEQLPYGAQYTAEGNLIGHMLQGRDIVREAAAGRAISPEILLRLEHVIISHQRLPEWGAPKPPMTPEALIVHYADDMDAKYNMMFCVLRDDTSDDSCTSKKNVLYQKVFKGL